MKNISRLIVIIVGVLLYGCEDFIDLNPISQQNSGSFYNSKTEIDQALTAAYGILRSGDLYGGNGFSSFMEVPSDNTWNLNTTMDGGAYAAFDNFLVDPTNVQVSRTWIACYNHIQQCNIVISRLKNLQVDDAYKTQRMGEARFLRAFTYFNMVRIWGDVPLITEEVTNVNDAFNHVRESKENVYKQIIDDLKAASSLPGSYAKADIGRVTAGAAKTLLAKVYLTRKDYNAASMLLGEVISSNSYSLVPVFGNVFSVTNKNNAEIIFAIQYDKTIEGQGYMGFDPLVLNSDINNLPSQNLLDLFNANADDRANATLINLPNQGWRLYKWHDTKGANGGLGFDIVVLRYADVLLMQAEALNEIAYKNENALTYLNAVRLRSHATAYKWDDLTTQDAFRFAIEKERRLELAFENHRWFDLVRTGKAMDVLKKSAGISVFKINISSTFQLLFPIPQSQIDASGKKLTQNADYIK